MTAARIIRMGALIWAGMIGAVSFGTAAASYAVDRLDPGPFPNTGWPVFIALGLPPLTLGLLVALIAHVCVVFRRRAG